MHPVDAVGGRAVGFAAGEAKLERRGYAISVVVVACIGKSGIQVLDALLHLEVGDVFGAVLVDDVHDDRDHVGRMRAF